MSSTAAYICLRGQPPPDFILSHRLFIEVAEDILYIVKTQRNSTQLKATSVGVRHSSHVFPTTPPPPPPTNFSATSRPARELKFGTDTH